MRIFVSPGLSALLRFCVVRKYTLWGLDKRPEV
nr:MAG TPA_asm: hypothetical protein [Caudoviricetes sp.]